MFRISSKHRLSLGRMFLQWEYHGGDNQQWLAERDGSDTFRIVSSESGQEMTVANSSAESNVDQGTTRLTQYQR
jgi:hypothetical protein